MQVALIAGGAGFIGSHLCKSLLAKDFKVICVDNLITGEEKNLKSLLQNPNFKFLKQDITKIFDPEEKIDFIFHLASPASPNHHSKKSYHSLPMETMMVNTLGTKNLLDLARKNEARFLFASSSEVYGDPLEHPQKEEYRGNVSTVGPRSVYDEAKRFGETLVSHYLRNGVDARIARIFNTYGPNMQKDDKRMIVDFINQAVEGKSITIFGDGSQTRSLCYVDDTVDGLIRLMLSAKAEGQVINIGSQDEHSVMEYAKIVKEITNSKSEIVKSEPLPQDDPKQRKPDITKAKDILGWEPKISLQEGLEKTVEYFRAL